MNRKVLGAMCFLILMLKGTSVGAAFQRCQTLYVPSLTVQDFMTGKLPEHEGVRKLMDGKPFIIGLAGVRPFYQRLLSYVERQRGQKPDVPNSMLWMGDVAPELLKNKECANLIVSDMPPSIGNSKNIASSAEILLYRELFIFSARRYSSYGMVVPLAGVKEEFFTDEISRRAGIDALQHSPKIPPYVIFVSSVDCTGKTGFHTQIIPEICTSPVKSLQHIPKQFTAVDVCLVKMILHGIRLPSSSEEYDKVLAWLKGEIAKDPKFGLQPLRSPQSNKFCLKGNYRPTDYRQGRDDDGGYS